MSTEILDKAIAHITKQAEEYKSQGKGPNEAALALMLSEHLIDKCTTLTVASALLKSEKKLSEVVKKLFDKATKQKSDNRAFITDAECCEFADEYYGLNPDSSADKAGSVIDVTDLL